MKSMKTPAQMLTPREKSGGLALAVGKEKPQSIVCRCHSNNSKPATNLLHCTFSFSFDKNIPYETHPATCVSFLALYQALTDDGTVNNAITCLPGFFKLKLTGSPCHTCETRPERSRRSRYPVVWRVSPVRNPTTPTGSTPQQRISNGVSGFPLEFTPRPDAGRE